MNAKQLWGAALIGAVVTTLLANVPVVNLINLLFCSGFWLGAVLAVWIARRGQGSLTMRQALAVGALTGALAGALGFAVSFIGLAGLQGMVNQIRLIAGPQNVGTMTYTLAEALGFNAAGVAFNIVFGVLGGAFGGALLRTDKGKTPAVSAGQA